MEEAIIRPDSWFNFFVHLNNVRAFLAALVLLRRVVKLPILSYHTTWLPFRLIKFLWIGDSSALRRVVAFIKKNSTVFL